MMKKPIYLLLLLMSLLPLSSLGRAETPAPNARETIRGTVDQVDLTGNVLNLVRTDQFKGEEITLLVSQNAIYEGIVSLNQLRRGQQILVEVEKNALGKLEIKKIQSAPPLAAAALATPSPIS